ncbi:MAG: threonylcarbamoyl-AMP synthase [Cytophagales bacterium CG12_big_fil_rev_8_21_14_0_65_40_12]|nr:MAG: threonylcarbamoyl-AMP synthase [Cytophagales bacterium CG12_big_fil_rev_8_21_14_0_65_40_12]PIW05685.1 MAG: threonylcarbamoyl-AMP synthase [Cytophagales bacterium CG17_big_fil_post_rev_8_21_14_2_50_40_13]
MAIIGDDIAKAKQLLDEGKLVAIPTETVYGLAGNATDAKVVAKIFEAKNRPTFDPLIVHIHSLDRLEELVEPVSELAQKLMSAFWPGPLTVLLKRKEIIPDLVTSGLDTVAIRMPQHELARKLLSILSYPLAAPSANPFGYISPTTAQHVQDQLGDQIDYILDGGECSVGLESTIVSFEEDLPTVLRLGGISVEDIEEVVGKVIVNAHSSSQPQAPGMLKSHYAPSKNIITIDEFESLAPANTHGFGYLGFSDFDLRFDLNDQYLLSQNEDLNEAAKNLFTSLRALDQIPHLHTIVINFVPDLGLGRAINDRLKRASAK